MSEVRWVIRGVRSVIRGDINVSGTEMNVVS